MIGIYGRVWSKFSIGFKGKCSIFKRSQSKFGSNSRDIIAFIFISLLYHSILFTCKKIYMMLNMTEYLI